MAADPPFDQTETLAFVTATTRGLSWRQQVNLEGALNGLYYDIADVDMSVFVQAMKYFLDDLFENVL